MLLITGHELSKAPVENPVSICDWLALYRHILNRTPGITTPRTDEGPAMPAL